MSSIVTVPDQPPDQPEMDLLSTMPNSNIRTRRWHSLFRAAYTYHKRKKPLGEGPGICDSIIAIFKYSCERHPLGSTSFSPFRGPSELGLNVLLIFMPLSVRVFDSDFAESDD
jgi:hypothetical protein